jgi:RNA polymerase sigma-70 factor (ECF subfamily)
MEHEAQVSGLVEHLFREESGKIISALTGSFGLRNLETIEDAVQEALLKALRVWSFGEVPAKPAAWLMQVARNRLLDELRRDLRWRDKSDALAREEASAEAPAIVFSDDEIRDDLLRMIFACCHPAIAREAQVAITLKIVCGFSVAEIARGFLLSEETVAKRLTRARQKLQSAVPFEIPSGDALVARLDPVLDVLYLLFNEGYNASHGEELIRRDLCDEAIRLTSLLAEHPAGDTPKTHALLALFLFQRARFDARMSASGEILLLADQERTRWNDAMITRGMSHLARARAGERLSEFHLQAGIAASHCAADTYEATDWKTILFFYDLLLELNPSPVIALNRAVAVWKVHGAAAALAEVEKITDDDKLNAYYLLYAVRGELHSAAGEPMEAKENLERALRLTNIPAEQNLVRMRLAALNRENF